jgi:hypothetical protein
MKVQKQRSRLSGIKILLASVALVAICFLAYALYTSYKSQANQPISTEAGDVQPAPEITTPNDLDKAQTTIESTELEEGNAEDLENIDKDLSEF